MPQTTNGSGTLSGNSITASNAISINGGTGVDVRVGDLVVALMAEQTALTASGVTDNLGNSYTAQNAGTLSTAVSGRLFWSRVTVRGVLTTVTIAATASGDDFACCAAVFNNGFDAPPNDVSPANGTGDVASPFTCPASGTLGQAFELVIGWSANNANATWSASAPFAIGAQASRLNASAVIIWDDVTSTGTVTPTMTGTNPANDVLGTMSFKQTVPLGQAML